MGRTGLGFVAAVLAVLGCAIALVLLSDERPAPAVAMATRVFAVSSSEDLCPGRALIPADAITPDGVALALIVRVADLQRFAAVRAATSARMAQDAVADVYRDRLVRVARAMGAGDGQLASFASSALPVPLDRGDGTFGLVSGHHVVRIPVGMVARACEIGELAEVEWLWADAHLIPTRSG